MSIGENKALVRRLYEEVFSQGDLPLADELIDPGAGDRSPDLFPGQAARGPDRIKQLVAWFRSAFPDATWTVDEMIAERDKVVCRSTFRGTHTGEFLGLPPTGKQVEMLEMRGFRMADGKIAESWGRAETFGLRHQLGEAPQLGPRAGATG